MNKEVKIFIIYIYIYIYIYINYTRYLKVKKRKRKLFFNNKYMRSNNFLLIYIKIKVNNKVGKSKLQELHKIKFHYLFGQLLLLWPILMQKEHFFGLFGSDRFISLWIRVVVRLPGLLCRMWRSGIKFGPI